MLGGFGQRLGVHRCGNKILVRFQQLRLCMGAMLGTCPHGLFALISNPVSPIGGLLAQLRGLLAGKYSTLARGERRRRRGGTRTLICLRLPDYCGFGKMINVTHRSLTQSTVSAASACVARPLRSPS